MHINLTIDIDIEWFRKLNCDKMTTNEFVKLLDDYVCNEIKEGFCEDLPYNAVYAEIVNKTPEKKIERPLQLSLFTDEDYAEMRKRKLFYCTKD